MLYPREFLAQQTPKATHLIFQILFNILVFKFAIKEFISIVFAVVSLLSEWEVDINVMEFFVGFWSLKKTHSQRAFWKMNISECS